jgi:hypothetical protein
MNWASPWEAATRCTGDAEPGARALLAWLLENYDDGFSLGIYNCRSVRGASTKSTHGEGRGVDFGLPMINGRANPIGHGIVPRLGAQGARLGIQTVIWDRRIWSAASPNGRPYTGVAPHYDHLHIELTRAAAAQMTLATFRAVLGEEEDFMATDEAKELLGTINHWVQKELPSRLQGIGEALGREVGGPAGGDKGMSIREELDGIRRDIRIIADKVGAKVES